MFFVISAVLAGKEVPAVSKTVESEEKEPAVEKNELAREKEVEIPTAEVMVPAAVPLEVAPAKEEKPAAKKPAAKKPAAKKPAAKKPAAKKPAAKKTEAKKPPAKKAATKPAKSGVVKKKKSVEAVEAKKIANQIKDSSKKLEEAHKKRTHKVNPVSVGCYSAVISNLITLGFIVLIAVVW